MKVHATPFSTLTDEEFVWYLLNKENATAEDVEAAIRLQQLIDSYSGLLEDIHRRADSALTTAANKADTLKRIREMTAPMPAQV